MEVSNQSPAKAYSSMGRPTRFRNLKLGPVQSQKSLFGKSTQTHFRSPLHPKTKKELPSLSTGQHGHFLDEQNGLRTSYNKFDARDRRTLLPSISSTSNNLVIMSPQALAMKNIQDGESKFFPTLEKKQSRNQTLGQQAASPQQISKQKHALEIKNRMKYQHPYISSRQNEAKKLQQEKFNMWHQLDLRQVRVKWKVEEQKDEPGFSELNETQNAADEIIVEQVEENKHENQNQDSKLKDSSRAHSREKREVIYITQVGVSKKSDSIQDQNSKVQDQSSNLNLSVSFQQQKQSLTSKLQDLNKSKSRLHKSKSTRKFIVEFSTPNAADQQQILTVNRLKASNLRHIYFTKSSIKGEFKDLENVYKLVNNPFFEMIDIKCEFYQIIKRLQSENEIDLNQGKLFSKNFQEKQGMFDVTSSKEKNMQTSFDDSPCFSLTSIQLEGCVELGKRMKRLNRIQVPFRLLPFLYFLPREDVEELLTQCVTVVGAEEIKLDENVLYEQLKGYEPSPLRTDFDSFSFKIVVNAIQSRYNYYVRVRMPFVQFEIQKETFKYLKESTLKVSQVFMLMYSYTFKNWESFVNQLFYPQVEENFLTQDGEDTIEGGENDIHLNTEELEEQLIQQKHLITKYITMNHEYAVFFKYEFLQYLRPMTLCLLEVNGLTDKVLNEFEIGFKHTKLLLSYLRDHDLKPNLLMRKLIDSLQVHRDEEKQLFKIFIDWNDFQKSQRSRTQRKGEGKELGNFGSYILIDGAKKAKLILKNAIIRFVSHTKERNVVQKEVNIYEAVQICDKQFENWEYQVLNAHHLM